ncbi:hypothetical protein ACF8O9_07815 [Stenotrophomonas geniculata]|jgi:hypothetical protein|uniref:hypothetical protein n=1 Tax=Stenotrophomonas TaxID=40323 RepID=UPI00370B7F47
MMPLSPVQHAAATGMLNRVNQREMESLFVQMVEEVCQVLTRIHGPKTPQKSEVLMRRHFC